MASRSVTAKEIVDAKKAGMGAADALALARSASKIFAVKGKNRVRLSPADATDGEILAAITGPTGNLRAPALMRGKTLLVGFHEDAYAEVLG